MIAIAYPRHDLVWDYVGADGVAQCADARNGATAAFATPGVGCATGFDHHTSRPLATS